MMAASVVVLLAWFIIGLPSPSFVHAFATVKRSFHRTTRLCQEQQQERDRSSSSSQTDDAGVLLQVDASADALYLERFKRRRTQVHTTLQEEQERRPPNPHLNPQQGVEAILRGLQTPHLPVQYFGFTALLQASSPRWRDWQDFRDAYRPGIGREEWERFVVEKFAKKEVFSSRKQPPPPTLQPSW